MTTAEARPAAAALVAAALTMVLQLLAVFSPSVAELDPEEMYNAGHAWVLADGHWDAVWRLQYREFCGGCTGAALLGAPLLAALGPSWLAWKLVPVGLCGLMAAVGTRACWREGGPAAGLAFAALAAFSPRAWTHLSLIAWGNHVEVGIFGLVALALLSRPGRARAAAAGMVTGLALWWSFSAAYLVVGLPVLLAVRGRKADLVSFVAAAPLGLLPWLLRYLDTGLHPFVTIYEPGEAAPRFARIPHKLATLLAPRQLVALFGAPDPPLGWVAGWAFSAALSASVWAAWRHGAALARGAGALALVWVGIYVLVRFQVWDPPSPAVASPGSVRYAAPLYPLVFVLVACGVGHWWRARRGVAVALLAGALAPGVLSRAEALAPPFPTWTLARRIPVDHAQFTPQFSYSLSAEEHRDCADADPDLAALHDEALGWHAATDALQGRGQMAPLDLAGVSAEDAGRGVAEAVRAQVGDGQPPRLAALSEAARLVRLAELGPAGERAALWQVAWLLVQEEGSWLPPGVPLDEGALQATSEAIASAPPGARDAAWVAAGRAWGKAVTGVAAPAPMHVPQRSLPAAFWQGLGRAAGEAWGPQAVAPPLPESADLDAFSAGYRDGLACCWLPPRQAPTLTR